AYIEDTHPIQGRPPDNHAAAPDPRTVREGIRKATALAHRHEPQIVVELVVGGQPSRRRQFPFGKDASSHEICSLALERVQGSGEPRVLGTDIVVYECEDLSLGRRDGGVPGVADAGAGLEDLAHRDDGALGTPAHHAGSVVGAIIVCDDDLPVDFRPHLLLNEGLQRAVEQPRALVSGNTDAHSHYRSLLKSWRGALPRRGREITRDANSTIHGGSNAATRYGMTRCGRRLRTASRTR